MNESAFNTGMFDYQRFKADVHLGAGAAGKTALLDGFFAALAQTVRLADQKSDALRGSK